MPNWSGLIREGQAISLSSSATIRAHRIFLFQTSDTTWQAYNSYGGNSLYTGSPAGRAYKVSYNRPFITRAGRHFLRLVVQRGVSDDSLVGGEWLQCFLYHWSGYGSSRRPADNHKVFLSVGHDEYWSGEQRANVEAARNAGVHLAFFSGNEVFWKTRWENSIDGSGTPYRTLVCYKETHAGAKIDPADIRDGRGREHGAILDSAHQPTADDPRTRSPALFSSSTATGRILFPFPRLTGPTDSGGIPALPALGQDQVATFAAGTLGYEWDSCPNNGVQPAGLMRLSSTTLNNLPRSAGLRFDLRVGHGNSQPRPLSP